MYGNFPDEKALFSREDIPDSFIEEIKKSANLFFQLQVRFYHTRQQEQLYALSVAKIH